MLLKKVAKKFSPRTWMLILSLLPFLFSCFASSFIYLILHNHIDEWTDSACDASHSCDADINVKFASSRKRGVTAFMGGDFSVSIYQIKNNKNNRK
jgi:hypothetical protein